MRSSCVKRPRWSLTASARSLSFATVPSLSVVSLADFARLIPHGSNSENSLRNTRSMSNPNLSRLSRVSCKCVASGSSTNSSSLVGEGLPYSCSSTIEGFPEIRWLRFSQPEFFSPRFRPGFACGRFRAYPAVSLVFCRRTV